MTCGFTAGPAHAGAQPEDGTSAILVAARAIARMKLGRVDAETTANVGVIDGGTATNIIPAECYVKCEARSRNIAKMEKQRDHMIACFQEEADAAEHYNRCQKRERLPPPTS